MTITFYCEFCKKPVHLEDGIIDRTYFGNRVHVSCLVNHIQSLLDQAKAYVTDAKACVDIIQRSLGGR